MAENGIEYPKKQEDSREYYFSESERKAIAQQVAKYPDKRSAVMPALWIAQEKWGWLSQKAILAVAKELGLPPADVYGVATFYTMYLKEYKAQHLVEVCTCFTCGECGGAELYHAIKEKYCDQENISTKEKFWIREAECLGACDTAPVIQVNNKRIVHNVTTLSDFETKVLAYLRKGELPPFVPIPPKNWD